MPEETPQPKRSPWMVVSVLLGVLLVASMYWNFAITAQVVGRLGAGGAVVVPAAGSPVPPAAGGDGAPLGGSVAVSADDDPALGPANAKVTVIEFSDFQCPFCKRFFDQTLGQIKSDYVETGKIRFAYRDFPLDSIHPNARPAAMAAECANEQGKFWEFHDKIFQNQQSMSTESYKQWAAELGLDAGQFNSCVDSNKYAQEVEKDFQDGVAAGVSGTPTVFVNGQKIVGAQPFEAFQAAIEQALAA
ncbi:MAG: DsbA family protein [Candidatus Aenigmarchaeota archaeon]|nr:DsbA family protein [Candidatus Aenigmarchaeota archaeon]